MSQRIFPVRVELDYSTNTYIEKWAFAEGKSKRRHSSILLRRLAALHETKLDELVRLGLAEAPILVETR